MRIDYGDADCYYIGAFTAAAINFPVWRASTICLVTEVEGSTSFQKFCNAFSKPPFRGTFATIFGMTWSRGTVFFGTDYGKRLMKEMGFQGIFTTIVPSVIASSLVQIINTPIVLGTIALQNPHTVENSVLDYIDNTVKTFGYRNGIFSGAMHGVIRIVPKYSSILTINDLVDEHAPTLVSTVLPLESQHMFLSSDGSLTPAASTLKSLAACVSGVLLTNPIDAIQAECIVSGRNPISALGSLLKQSGPLFAIRGMTGTMMAVAFPMSITMCVSDMFMRWKHEEETF